MSIRKAWCVAALGIVLVAGPAKAATVWFFGNPFSPGDDGFFYVDNITSAGYFDLVFQVTSPVALSVANGVESNALTKKDMSNLAVSLTGSTDGLLAGLVGYTSSLNNGRTVDGFNAEWSNLKPGQNYMLRLAYDLSGPGTGADTFAGQLSFSSVPIPPAMALFGSGLFGIVLLARRRQKPSRQTDH